METGSSFILITFLLSIHSSPLHLHPLPPLRNQGFYPLPVKPQCLERPQENEKPTANKHEDRTECLWLRQQKRHKTETHPRKKAPQAKASLRAEHWQRRWCMSPLNRNQERKLICSNELDGVLTLWTRECDLIWKKDFSRRNYEKIILGYLMGPRFNDKCPYKRQKSSQHREEENAMWRQRQKVEWCSHKPRSAWS